jgi:hypothetical protein
MLKTKDKADNKVSRVRVISKVKAMDSSKVLVKRVVMDRDKVRVSPGVMVVVCRRKCKTTTTVISRLLMT